MRLSKLFLMAFMLAGIATGTSASATCPAADPQQIRDIYAHWLDEYRARDLIGVMTIFDKHVLFQFQGSHDQGWEALRAGYQKEFATSAKSQWSPTYGQIEASGDMAAAFAIWRLVSKTADGAETISATNNSVDVFRRDANCQWKIVRSLNYPVK